MAVKNELEFKSFDDFAEMLQDEENRKSNQYDKPKVPVKQEPKNSTVPHSKRYYRRTGPVVISLEEYKKRVENGSLIVQEKTNNSKNATVQNTEEKRKVKTPQAKKIKKPKILKDKGSKEAQEKKKEQKRITKISKQIERNLARQTRYTEPKERNLLSRIILQNKLAKGHYDYIEDNYNFFTEKELKESKEAKKRSDRALYKEVREYEDAKDDVTTRRGWKAFKIGLGAALLAGALALGNYLDKEVKETFNSTSANKIVSIENIDEENRDYYEDIIERFSNQVKENDGYEFDYLSEDELLDGYLRILNKESKMIENSFKGAMYNLGDQILLDNIVSKAFGEEEYALFSEEQKRDYRQLAFELLPISQPEIFGSSNLYIRNPIVCDELQAKKDAKAKGYFVELIVNADKPEAVRNIGRLIHVRNILKETNLQAVATNNGQNILEDMIKQALGEQYESLSEKELRDYKQIAYEFLDDTNKNYVKDPIELEKSAEDIEIGD